MMEFEVKKETINVPSRQLKARWTQQNPITVEINLGILCELSGETMKGHFPDHIVEIYEKVSKENGVFLRFFGDSKEEYC